jgi:hypothetical protein
VKAHNDEQNVQRFLQNHLDVISIQKKIKKSAKRIRSACTGTKSAQFSATLPQHHWNSVWRLREFFGNLKLVAAFKNQFAAL